MYQAQLLQALRLLYPYAKVHNKWIQLRCPFAIRHGGGVDNVPSFGVHLDAPHKYACFACNAHGRSFSELVTELHDNDIAFDKALLTYDTNDVCYVLETVNLKPSAPVIYPESWLETYAPAYTDSALHPYLIARNVPLHIAKYLDIRYNSSLEHICFPIRNKECELVGLRCRNISGDDTQPKYYAYRYKGAKNSYTLYGANWVDTNRTVVITESVFDVASVLLVYGNVVSPLTVNFSKECISPLTLCRKVVTLFDSDLAGDVGRYLCDMYLPGIRITHLNTSKDAKHSCTKYKDCGEMPREYVAELLRPHIGG